MLLLFYRVNRTLPHRSGTCMSIRPCGDQTQLSSFWPGGFTYLPSTTLVRHSTREKLTRHSAPSAGRETGAREANAAHGNAISTVQPRSVSRGLLSVPFTETAVRNPDVPTVVGLAALAVRLGQEEVPPGIEGVDLEFEVVAAVARRVQEDFEIVIVENNGIVLGEGGPDVRLFEFGGHIEELFVPQHFDARVNAGTGFPGALDIDEPAGPRGLAPGGVIQAAVDLEGRTGTVAGVVLGLRLRVGRAGGKAERGGQAAHYLGQMLATSMLTLGKCLGVSVPSAKTPNR